MLNILIYVFLLEITKQQSLSASASNGQINITQRTNKMNITSNTNSFSIIQVQILDDTPKTCIVQTNPDYSLYQCSRNPVQAQTSVSSVTSNISDHSEVILSSQLHTKNSMISMPFLGIKDPSDLINGSSWNHFKFTICGVPIYCPDQKQAQLKFKVQNYYQLQPQADMVNVKKGELCSWFFEGDNGPDFLISIQGLPQKVFNISTCLDIDKTRNTSSYVYILEGFIKFQLLSKQFSLILQQFRISIQFTEDTLLNLNDFEIKLISTRLVQQLQTQQLFDYLYYMLVGFLGTILICLFLKKVLILIFGRAILRWIDPEPLFPQQPEGPLNDIQLKNSINQLIQLRLIKVIQFESKELLSPQYNQNTCSFCLEEFQENKKQLVKLFCEHVYHENCWTSWIRVQRNNFYCPICKRALTQQEQSKVWEEKLKRSIETEPSINDKTYQNLNEEERASA